MRTKPCGFNQTRIIKPSGLTEWLLFGFKSAFLSSFTHLYDFLSLISRESSFEFHRRKEIQVWSDMRARNDVVLLFFLYFQYFSFVFPHHCTFPLAAFLPLGYEGFVLFKSFRCIQREQILEPAEFLQSHPPPTSPFSHSHSLCAYVICFL